ncbi:hypothetical protein LRS06_07150 [Hymenobacter sp. J193]|uniref:hypothetical protein n=1 Tax=Hymenobacter sp. J193 TaxID=2898429 RepID=UPI002150E6D6|nr:hypothetical protein [Hymenobacter sp. J193]MCR5887556.1 hypothetical protein [Hymenobacter sp. J193]
MFSHSDILTEDQLIELCQQVAESSEFWEGLAPYPKQAVKNFASKKIAQLSNYPEDERNYYLIAFPIFNYAKQVLKIAESSRVKQSLTAPNRQNVEPAKLRCLTIMEVRTIFSEAGLGAASKQGEWSAAAVALSVADCLVGNAQEIELWLIESGFQGKMPSRRTIHDSLQCNQSEMVKNTAFKTVFESVLRKAKAKCVTAK